MYHLILCNSCAYSTLIHIDIDIYIHPIISACALIHFHFAPFNFHLGAFYYHFVAALIPFLCWWDSHLYLYCTVYKYTYRRYILIPVTSQETRAIMSSMNHSSPTVGVSQTLGLGLGPRSHVSQDEPTKSIDLRSSRQISSTPDGH